MSGRPKAATKAEVLQVIHDTVTVSASELAKSLNVNRATVYRRLREISQQEIEQALGINEKSKLTPAEKEFKIFFTIPKVKEFYESLRYLKKRTERYSRRMVHGLHRICIHTGKHPLALDYKDVRELMIKIAKGEVPIKDSETKKAIRAWFRFTEKSLDKLTEMGVDGVTELKGRDRSMLKFTQEQRHKIVETIEGMTLCNFKNKTARRTIPFGDQPELRKSILQLPIVAFYTGTRIGVERVNKDGKHVPDRGLLSMKWENTKIEAGVVIFRVIDKGKRGGITWFKKLIGKPAEDFKRFWENMGCPTSGRIFPFGYPSVLAFFNDVYQAAGVPEHIYKGMPLHIWRHTAAQELLEVTDWNYGLTAKTLGWDGTQALEKHYGKMTDSSQLKGLRKAMGLPVDEVKREFKF